MFSFATLKLGYLIMKIWPTGIRQSIDQTRKQTPAVTKKESLRMSRLSVTISITYQNSDDIEESQPTAFTRVKKALQFESTTEQILDHIEEPHHQEHYYF